MFYLFPWLTDSHWTLWSVGEWAELRLERRREMNSDCLSRLTWWWCCGVLWCVVVWCGVVWCCVVVMWCVLCCHTYEICGLIRRHLQLAC